MCEKEQEKTQERMSQDMLLQLHEQYAVNNNANLSSMMMLIVAAIAIFGAYGYAFVNTSLLFAENFGDFAGCVPNTYKIDVLLLITLAIFVVIGILQYICMYQGCHQRYEQFTTYAERCENGLGVNDKFGQVFTKNYHPFYKCDNESRKRGICAYLRATVCPNHDMERIAQGLFGEFVWIFSYILWIIYIFTVFKLIVAVCEGHCTLLSIAIIIVLHLFIAAVNMLVGYKAMGFKDKYKALCEEYNKYRPLKANDTLTKATKKSKNCMLMTSAWLLFIFNVVLFCFHANWESGIKGAVFNIISLVLALVSIGLAIYVFLNDKKKNKIYKLVDQVQAFYLEEDTLIHDICKYRKGEKPEDVGASDNYRTVKTEYRNKAEKHPKNVKHVRPSMSYKEADAWRNIV